MARKENIFRAKKVSFYRLGPILSRNGVINIVLGPRGDGKTFAAKEQAIRNAINKEEQFIYLRRYRKELDSRTTFFDDIRFKFPDHEFMIRGHEALMKRPNSSKWETIGYFVALSISQQKKSVAYPKVSLIIFDEFLIDKGAIRYLPQEQKVFLDFLSTVDRYQDRVRAILISNTVSIMNPYFHAWGIKPRSEGEWFSDPTGFVVVHFIKDHVFAEQVRETRLGAFIADTDYGAYAIDAQFADNHDSMLKLKPPSATYKATIETESGVFSWWADSLSGLYYIQEKRPKGDEIMLTMIADRMDETKSYLPYNNKLVGMLRTSFSHGRMYFDTAQARNAFLGVFV